jgi:hypothetical protein
MTSRAEQTEHGDNCRKLVGELHHVGITCKGELIMVANGLVSSAMHRARAVRRIA